MRHLTLPVLILAVTLAACRHTTPAPPSEAAVPGWQLEWADGVVFYEVFVRSFADADGDGIGDLRGLTARLDDLNDGDPATTSDLGVEGIWLMPVFASPSYHGYDVVNYRAVEADYGTMADLEAFLAAAHDRGIRVVVDLMINHTSSEHPWFVESASSPDAARRDWYVWRDSDPGWTQPWGGGPTWHEHGGAYYYGIFWSGMPDLNFGNPEVVAEVENIADFWLARGVDGFRLDAARHITAEGPGELQNDTPATHAFWKRFSAHVRSVDPSALLIGENWTSTVGVAPYFGSTAVVAGGDELPMNFNFALAEAILEAVQLADARPVVQALAEVERLYPPGVLDGTFLTNHDMPRVATQLGGDQARLRSAAAILLTLPGTPFLYYGEEVGLVGDKPDPDIRTPMPWTDQEPGGGFTSGTPWYPFAPGRAAANVAAQSSDDASPLAHYRRLIRLRRDSPALRRGDLEVLSPSDQRSPVLAFTRRGQDERLLVAHNLAAGDAAAGPWPLGTAVPELVWSSREGAWAAVGQSGVSLLLPAGASAVWRLR